MSINKQLKNKCEDQSVSLVVYWKVFICCSGRVDLVKWQLEGLRAKVEELQRWINDLLRQVCYDKVKAQVGEIWGPGMCNGTIWIYFPEGVGSADSPEP